MDQWVQKLKCEKEVAFFLKSVNTKCGRFFVEEKERERETKKSVANDNTDSKVEKNQVEIHVQWVVWRGKREGNIMCAAWAVVTFKKRDNKTKQR